MLPIPGKLLAQGVRDMVRISDARMSGTAYGTCVLHVSPESWIGGPLALVEEGDPISLDAENGQTGSDGFGCRIGVAPRAMGAARAAI